MFYYFFLAIYTTSKKRKHFYCFLLDCVHTKDIPEDVLNTYCWIHSTYTIPSAFWKRIGIINLRGNVKKRVYLKTLSNQVGGWSWPFQKFFNELIFDIRWGQFPFQ